MPEPIWYAGICDRMLARILWWSQNWSRGDIFATRPFLTTTGKVENIVTKRLLKVPFHPEEFKQLVRILKIVKPVWELTADMEVILPKLNKCQLVGGGLRLIPIATFKQECNRVKTALRVPTWLKSSQEINDGNRNTVQHW